MKQKNSIQEIIYNFHKKNEFFDIKNSFGLRYGFSYNNFKDMVFKNIFIKDGVISESKENIICALIDTQNSGNDIFFTEKALYIEDFSIKQEKIRIYYSEINKIQNENELFLINGQRYKISEIWKTKNIAKFLYFISSNYNFENRYDFKEAEKYIKSENIGDKEKKISLASKVIYGNISDAATNYGMDKFSTPRGHGFAAERVNHIYDKLMGKQAKIVGDNNATNGADRVVDGVAIQSKYCSSGSRCIQECFKNGKFRYLNADGTPMQIEVPSDKYDSAVEAMKNRIRRGEIPKITNPEEAKNIVRKGHFTYEQVKNIAKAGTIESISFDSINGMIIGTSSFGITSCITFATSIWNGENYEKALRNAIHSGLKVGGTAFITAVLSSQFSRVGLNSFLIGGSEAVVGILGSKASAVLVNAFRSGSNIYGGAALKSAAKLLRGNAITGVVSVAVLSSIDIINIFRGRISGTQLFKNMVNTASVVAGGTAGWLGGATAGAAVGSFIPFFGTVAGGLAGGLIGSVVGGTTAGRVSDKVLNNFIEDDVNEMVRIIEQEFSKISLDYLLGKEEAEKIADRLKERLTESVLRDMYASNDRCEFAKNMIEPYAEQETRYRERITLPTDREMYRGIKEVLEEIAI